jgi:hypothetical protein
MSSIETWDTIKALGMIPEDKWILKLTESIKKNQLAIEVKF